MTGLGVLSRRLARALDWPPFVDVEDPADGRSRRRRAVQACEGVADFGDLPDPVQRDLLEAEGNAARSA